MKMQALSIGPIATDVLKEAQACLISAAFRRSFHIGVDDHIICLVDASLGNGPLNITLPREAMNALAGLPVGACGTISDDSIRWNAQWHISCADSPVWRPDIRAGLAPAIDSGKWRSIIDMASRMAPPESFFHVAYENGTPPVNVWMRAARPRVAALTGWLHDLQGAPPVQALLGLGGGLTPSGDDLIGGILLALHAAGQRNALEKIAAAVRAAPPESTTVLSRDLLNAACRGIGHEILHGMMAAIENGFMPEIRRSMEKVSSIGHSSGWDSLAGILIGWSAGKSRALPPGRLAEGQAA